MISLIKNEEVNKIILMLSDIRIRYFGGEKQFLPTLEDMDNKELKKLANRLKGDSNKETFTNILEWEGRNIVKWADRKYMQLTLGISWILSAVLLFASAVLLSLSIDTFIVLIYILFGAFIGLIVYQIVYLKVYLKIRYKDVKDQIPEFRKWDIFKSSLPVNKILIYKLAICADYAKLTAALFFNYPDSKVYFFSILAHVAMAVKIKDEYYILDQKLPVLTKNSWLKRWNVKEANVYSSELVRNSTGQIIGVDLKKPEKIHLSDFSGKDDNPVNAAELTEKVSKVLGINQISQKEMPDFDFPLKDYAVYYEDNDIVKHSLSRAIKNKLENEFCGNVGKISKIEISQCENKKDLSLSVYL